MDTADPQSGEREDTVATLGDVLYADKTCSYVSEQEWVALVRDVAAGDQHALHALFERAHRIVFTLTMRITGNRETAEELTLDVFHDVWRRASAYDPANGTVVGWIMNQARSRAIDRLRFDGRRKRIDPYPDSPAAEVAAGSPHEIVEAAEEARVLRSALTSLTVHEREAIETTYFSGLTHAEAAARLNQPLGTIKTRIRAGLAKLRQALGEKL
jgi:RNA polymerase sigma-70 factor (ECF subfamily)